MRLVTLADTHLFHRYGGFDVPDGDVLIHAGDLCRLGTLEELAVAVAWLRDLPHPTKIIVAGNHDWAFQREPAAARELLAEAGLIYLEDSGAVVHGLRVWGSPWQPEFAGWAFNLPRGPALAAKWALFPDGLDVLITHAPPRGIGDRAFGQHLGCDDLRARVAVARPRVHLFGHIHEDGGAFPVEGTLFVNCTVAACERPPTVVDLEARGVCYPGFYDAQDSSES